MRVFITGGTGFVGSRVARELVRRGDEVIILARSKVSGFDDVPKIQFVRGELGKLGKDSDRILDGVDGVIHCGAHVAPFGEWKDFERINIFGTKELLDASLRNNVKSFVNFSTPSVYVRYQDKEGIKESDPLPEHQLSMYGKSKAAADLLVQEAASKGLNACSLRPRGVIGAGDRNIFPRMLRIAEKGFFPLVRGGHGLFDATVIDNLVEVTIQALDRAKDVRGEIFNISNGEPLPLKELSARLFAALDVQVKFRNVPWPLAKGVAQVVEKYFELLKPGVEPPISVYSMGLTTFSQTLNISKAKRLLAYQPKMSINDGITQFSDWWRSSSKG